MYESKNAPGLHNDIVKIIGLIN